VKTRVFAIVAGAGFLGLGLWAMADPHSFFEAVATFEPYNQHFVQDIGAFQIGLGAVLLLAASRAETDALAVALIGVGIGAALHAGSHVVGSDLGGRPEVEIPAFLGMAILLLIVGGIRWRSAG
jgi:hypothetical protein